MSNMCSNTLKFYGKKENVDRVNDFMKALVEKSKIDKYGVYTEDVEDGDDVRYMFDLEGANNTFLYKTKWSCDVAVIERLADKYDVDFELYYDEASCYLHGVYFSRNRMPTEHIFLEENLFELFEENADTGMVHFMGQEFQQLDLFYELLKIKMNKWKSNQN